MRLMNQMKKMGMKMNLENELREIKTAAITGHIRPDGDCIGSCLGLYHYLADNFPEIQADIYLEPIADKFFYIKDTELIRHTAEEDKEYDLCIVLDCGDLERIGKFETYFKKATKTWNIDHHISNNHFADWNNVEVEAAATSEILFGMMEKEKISLNTAIALYTGIVHDTGVFKHSNTTSRTMRIAAELLEKGVPSTEIIENSFFQKTYIQNQIMGRALLESVLFYHKTCIFTALRMKDMEFYNVTPKDLDGIVSQLVITEGVECAIFLYEIAPQVYKVSLRSKKYVDVSRVAMHFGGGGHVRAAGCEMLGSVHDVVNNLSREIGKQMEGMEKSV